MLVLHTDAITAFYEGLREGVSMYAHWKDGVTYVGTTGKTLAKALADINEREKKELEAGSHD